MNNALAMSVTTPPPLKAFEGGGVVKCFLFSGLRPELKEGGKRGEGGGGGGSRKAKPAAPAVAADK